MTALSSDLQDGGLMPPSPSAVLVLLPVSQRMSLRLQRLPVRASAFQLRLIVAVEHEYHPLVAADRRWLRAVDQEASHPPVGGYERVVFMFDGYDQAQLEGARAHWKTLKAEGHALTYWQQNQDGRWVKKA